MQIGGFVGDYLKGITQQWLLVAPKANPGMLEMFRDRDISPRTGNGALGRGVLGEISDGRGASSPSDVRSGAESVDEGTSSASL